MQIVIDIPEEYYNILKTYGGMSVPEEAILNGTILPKGHGRLIDADEIIHLTNEIEAEGVEDREDRLYYLFLKTVLKDAPTIIEADIRSKEEWV